jgi:phosphoribosylformylglycinamidine synthase
MWQLSECIDGMAESCRALGLPVIGGNVSLYNESGGADIDPTPVLGVLGLVDVVRAAPPGLAWSEGDTIVLIGPRWAGAGAGGEAEPFPLEGTRWATERRDHRSGILPPLDLEEHGAVCAFVAGLIAAVVGGAADPPLVSAVHDVSSGGLGLALAEMATAGGVGCHVALAEAAELFSELPSRFVVATPMPDDLCARAEALGIATVTLGRAGGGDFVVDGLVDVSMDDLGQAYEGNLASWLGES